MIARLDSPDNSEALSSAHFSRQRAPSPLALCGTHAYVLVKGYGSCDCGQLLINIHIVEFLWASVYCIVY